MNYYAQKVRGYGVFAVIYKTLKLQKTPKNPPQVHT